MQANLPHEFCESEGSDGFNLIPRNPKKVFLLKLNPLIHHLPTELAAFKINKWRVPPALAKMDAQSVVIFWQDGPNAGIYGIGVPFGKFFMTDSYFFTPATHLEFCRYGFKEVKLRCIYIPPTPILSTTLNKTGEVVREMKRPRVKLSTACKLSRHAWNELYDLMSHGRNSANNSASNSASGLASGLASDLASDLAGNLAGNLASNLASNSDVATVITDQHQVVELVQRRENNVFSLNGEIQSSDPYALARSIWNVLASSVNHETPVNYSSLGGLFGAKPGDIRSVLTLIDEVCVFENLPKLASPILLNHESQHLYEHPQSTLNESLKLFVAPAKSVAGNFDWEQVPNPFDFTLQRSSHEIMRELEADPTPEQAAEIYKMIKVRGTAQQIFARLMRRLYDRQCAFCGFSMPFALEAAHIKPWPFCTPGERLSASNGLLLCSVHHKLFDAGLITLSISRAKRFTDIRYVVRVLAPTSLLCISKADVDYVKQLDGVTARVPRLREHQPKAEFLDFRKNWLAEKLRRSTDN